MIDFSLRELASNIEFDVEDYSPLLKLFIDTTDLDLSRIRTAAASSDNDLLSSNIHNIKGASLNLGLDKITEIVDQMSKLNKDSFLTDIEGKVKECEAELIKLRILLE